MDKRTRDIRRPPLPIFATKKPRTALLAHPNNIHNGNNAPLAYSNNSNRQWSSNDISTTSWQNQQSTQQTSWQQQPPNQSMQQPTWQQQQHLDQHQPREQQQSNQGIGMDVKWHEQEQPYNQGPNQAWKNPYQKAPSSVNGSWRQQGTNIPRQTITNISSNPPRQNQYPLGQSVSAGQRSRQSQYKGQQQHLQRGPQSNQTPLQPQQNMDAGDYNMWSSTEASARQSNQPSGYGSNSCSGQQGWEQANRPSPSPRYGHTPNRSAGGDQQLVATNQPWGMATGGHASANSSTSAQPTPGAGSTLPQEGARIAPRGADNSLKILSATVQGMQYWAKYKDKIPVIFELIGRMDSAMSIAAKFGCHEFMLKDNKNHSICCIFYEIDRELPRLVRGQQYRCVGRYEADKKRVQCVSVRTVSDSEQKLHAACVTASDRAMREWVCSARET